MLDEASNRLGELDRSLDARAVIRALAVDLGGRPRPLGERTDPAVGVMRDELVDLLVRPGQVCSTGHPSPAARRRAERCRLSFDEGYLVGRIGLDTHRLPLLWSGHAGGPPAPLPPGLDDPVAALRTLALSPTLAARYAGTTRLAALVRDLTDETRGVPADQSSQFGSLGLLTSVAEWTLLVGAGPGLRRDLLLAGC